MGLPLARHHSNHLVFLRLSTNLHIKSTIINGQIADFVCWLLRNKSNMIWNFLSHVHTYNLSMNKCRTLSIDTNLWFCLQVRTKPKKDDSLIFGHTRYVKFGYHSRHHQHQILHIAIPPPLFAASKSATEEDDTGWSTSTPILDGSHMRMTWWLWFRVNTLAQLQISRREV